MRSVLVRANPLTLLIVGISALPASVAVRDVRTGVVALAAYVLAGLLLLPSLRAASRRSFIVLLGAISVAWSTWLLGGHEPATAVAAGLRVLVLALPGAVVAGLVDPAGLADQLAQRLRLPDRPVVAFAAALQRFEHLGGVWQQLHRARRARGVGPSRSPVSQTRHAGALTFGLLVSSLRTAATLSVAMDARGFASGARRTWAEPALWRAVDSAVVAGAVVLAALPYVLAYWL